MSKLNFEFLNTSERENRIAEYASFFRKYLSRSENRLQNALVIENLHSRLQKASYQMVFTSNTNYQTLDTEITSTIRKLFGEKLLDVYRKVPKRVPKPTGSAFGDVLTEIAATPKFKWEHELKILAKVRDCLRDCGIHPETTLRLELDSKRYNVILWHRYERSRKTAETRVLLAGKVLQDEILIPYSQQKPVKFNGKFIPFHAIVQFKITSTLLKASEIDLFAIKNRFEWSERKKEHKKFAEACLKDETDQLLANPHLLNNASAFVNQSRIQDLKAIANPSYDLAKVIALCEEISLAAKQNMHLSVALLLRALIDHVPPAFSFKTFNEVANNYVGGGTSFKKAMLKFQDSLRNIADGHIHMMIRSKESLPTAQQVNFSSELDLLLSELIRILK